MQFFPPHVCYVEPFGGAAGVLLQKEPSYSEVYNDLDGDIVNFFRVLRDPATRGPFIDACVLTPYARDELDQAYEPTADPVERARRTAVRAAMAFGSAGATKGTSGFRIDTRRKNGTASHVWANYPDGVAAVGERFARVVIENRPAIKVMQQHDEVDTLHFVDPPYLPATRVGGSRGRFYRCEMSVDEHVELLNAVRALTGMVVLCGYPSDLYDGALKGWGRYSTEARASGHRGTVMREEVVWINPACEESLIRSRGDLFAHEVRA